MADRGYYRGIYTALLDDPDFQQLSPEARLTFLVCRTCRDAGPAAIFRYYEALLMIQTGLPAKALRRAFHDLEEGHWIERDAAVLWIRNGLRYDPNVRLADPKHRKAVETVVKTLPKSKVVLNFCDYYEITRPFEGPSMTLLTGEGEGVGEGIEVGEGTTPPTPPPGGATWPSPQALADLYNETAADECQEVTTLSPQRLRAAKRCLKDFPSEQFWREAFAETRASLFLRGLKPPSPGRSKPFLASFDWFLQKHKDGTENCVKAYEGTYRD